MKILSSFKKSLIGAALLAAATAAQAASYNIFNDFTGWLGSVESMGSTTLGTGTFVGVGCAPGVSCPNVAVNGLPGVGFAQNGSGSASYDGGLLNNLNGGYLEWNFTTAQNGWGGAFQMATGNAGLSFEANDLNLGWIDVTSIVANQALNGFFGFTSTDEFLGVRVAALPQVGGGPVGSSYRMTDVSVAAATVPEPGSLALLALGGLAFGLVRRQRKA